MIDWFRVILTDIMRPRPNRIYYIGCRTVIKMIKRQSLRTKTVRCNFNEIIILKKIETRVRRYENKIRFHDGAADDSCC